MRTGLLTPTGAAWPATRQHGKGKLKYEAARWLAATVGRTTNVVGGDGGDEWWREWRERKAMRQSHGEGGPHGARWRRRWRRWRWTTSAIRSTHADPPPTQEARPPQTQRGSRRRWAERARDSRVSHRELHDAALRRRQDGRARGWRDVLTERRPHAHGRGHRMRLEVLCERALAACGWCY